MRQWSQRYARGLYRPEGEVVRWPPNFAPVPYCPPNPGSFFLKRKHFVHQSGFTEAFIVRSGPRRLPPKPPEFACLVDPMPLKAVIACDVRPFLVDVGNPEVIQTRSGPSVPEVGISPAIQRSLLGR